MIQTQQEDREWKQVNGLQNELQTLTKQTEFLSRQIETL